MRRSSRAGATKFKSARMPGPRLFGKRGAYSVPGFVGVRVEILEMKPLSAACVLAEQKDDET